MIAYFCKELPDEIPLEGVTGDGHVQEQPLWPDSSIYQQLEN